MEAGIVGLSYIGKTSVFNALTALGVGTETSATKPNVGVVQVPDPRMDTICKYVTAKKVIHATIQLVDVAGLVAGSSEGKGTGNKFLSHLRNVDALLHVARCFEDDSVPHVDGSVNPIRDIEEVETELIIADQEVVENSIRNAEKKARMGDKETKMRYELMKQCLEVLENEKPLRTLELDEENERLLKSFAMLTAKPVLYLMNVGEDDLTGENQHAQKVRAYAAERGSEALPICAKLEAELMELDESERMEMLGDLGLAEPSLNAVARGAYKILGLQSFFTAGEKENRAWTIPIGATGPQAAGAIHSDFERGFIRVEVHSVDELEQYKTEQAIKAAGKMRVEGKHYVMQDGDVCHFLFNV